MLCMLRPLRQRYPATRFSGFPRDQQTFGYVHILSFHQEMDRVVLEQQDCRRYRSVSICGTPVTSKMKEATLRYFLRFSERAMLSFLLRYPSLYYERSSLSSKDVYNPGDLCNDGSGGAWMLCNIASSRELKSSGTNSRVYAVATWMSMGFPTRCTTELVIIIIISLIQSISELGVQKVKDEGISRLPSTQASSRLDLPKHIYSNGHRLRSRP